MNPCTGPEAYFLRLWLLLVVLAASCTPLPTPVVISEADATMTAQATVPVVAAPPDTSAAISTSVLRLGVASWRGFDPLDAVDAGTEQVQALIYETLLAYDTQGNLLPLLAADLPAVDATGLIWGVRLKEGVAFHDGTLLDGPLAAADFQRLIDPALESATLPEAVRVFRQVVESVAGEGMSLTFRLRQSFRAFSSLLAEQALALTHGVGIGSGPFQQPVAVSGGGALRLGRYAGYHAGAPLLEVVEVYPAQEIDGGMVIMEGTTANSLDLVAGQGLPAGIALDGFEAWSVAGREQWLILGSREMALLPDDIAAILALALEASPDAYYDALAERGLPDGFDLAVSPTGVQESVAVESLARLAPVRIQVSDPGRNPQEGTLIAGWTREWARAWWLQAAGQPGDDPTGVGVLLHREPIVTYVRPNLTGLGVTAGGWARITATTGRP